MFAAIYSFKIHPGKDADFLNSWKTLTKLIHQYEDSLGSRLHRASENEYIAYAQWPNRERWLKSGKKLPASANKWRKQMRACCAEIKTLHELEMIEDLLIHK